MGSIEDRNGMDLTEAEEIKNRWQEYMGKLYKKDLHNPEIEQDPDAYYFKRIMFSATIKPFKIV